MSTYIDNSVIEFGDSVKYICEPGFFFEEDYFKEYFNVTCLTDGSWDFPDPWPLCLNPASRDMQ